MSETGRGGAALPPEVIAELQRRRLEDAAAGEKPAIEPGAGGTPSEDRPPARHPWLKGLGGLGAILLLLFKFKAVPLLILGKLKLVLPFVWPLVKTGGSMLVYVWFSAQFYGLPFAVGLVLCIFVHEMGHVLMMRSFGHPFSAPLFIPGMGAVIFQKSGPKSVWESAVVGIAGPAAGLLAGLVCHCLFFVTGNGLFLALAYTGYLLNLFNMTPIFPLDGGWITAAVSPRLWLVGIIILGGMVLTGFLRNPLIILLLLMSLPRLIHGLRTGSPEMPGSEMHREPATPAQRIQMGIAYVALAGVLAALMATIPMRH